MNEKYWGEKKSPIKKNAQNTSPEKHISVHENKIYYYAGVNRDSASELNKKIGELEAKSWTLCHNLDLDQPPTLRIYINSGGGSITAGISSSFFIGTLVYFLYTSLMVFIIKSRFCFSSSKFEYVPQNVLDS